MTLAAGRALAIGLRRAFHVVDGWVSYSADGVIVVATANRGRDLEPALRRRFNVIAEYCRRRTALAEAIALAVGQCEGFTFAELAAAYTTAGPGPTNEAAISASTARRMPRPRCAGRPMPTRGARVGFGASRNGNT